MSKSAKIIVFSAILAFCSTGFANVLLVPSPYPTIQSAINAAVNGDTVIVAPGTYTGPGNRDIDFLGKSITVRSENGPENCIIDCENSGPGFYFHNYEDANSTLAGFTIINGNQGGICCDLSSPTITNCIIRGNESFSGGGIGCFNSDPLITSCTITGNSARENGGGIYYNYQSNPTITNCVISGNSSDEGGGIYSDSEQGNPTITNCIISGNSSDEGGGIHCGFMIMSSPIITNCIFWNNAAQTGAEIYGSANVTYSDVRGGRLGEGNINVEPLLTPDGRLQAGSPCINAGDPDFLPEPGQVDIDGQPRVMGGRVDMGADEVTAPLVSAIVLSSKKFYFNFNQGGPAPAIQILSIRNLLEDTLNWEVTEDCPWLDVYPNTGTSTDEPDYITLSVDTTGLAAGVYKYTFTIFSPTAAPRMVPVTLCVYNPESLIVPIEYPTIQSAIDAAIEIRGDTVVVVPGTYSGDGNWDIDFLGKAITVRSADPNDPNIVAETIINCHDPYGYPWHYGFGFHNNEDANSVLDGFTITNSHSTGAIACDSSPTIKNCIITGNSCDEVGGINCHGYPSHPAIINCTISNNIGSGIYCYGYRGGYDDSPEITNCTITGNTGSGMPPGVGGGIYCWDSSPRITSCTITGNYVWDGGGIYCNGESSPVITNCTITGNSAMENGGGIYLRTSLPISVTNSIIWGNTDSNGSGLSAQVYSGKPDVWFSCIQDDNPNDANIPFGADKYNIDDDPCFVDPGTVCWDDNNTPADPYDDSWFWTGGDYHLLPASPCIEAGNPFFTYHAGDVDMDGQPRLMGRRVDMGADEAEVSVIVVTRPKGGEVWTGGSTHEVTWDSYTITGTVDIYYSINNGADWVKIANVPDTGSFIWDLPTSQFPGLHRKSPIDSNQCLVVVKPDNPPANLTCIESGPFTIQPYRSWPPHPWRPGYPQRPLGPRYGCVKWQFQTGGPVTAGVTVGLNNRIHVPCEDGKLYTLNPAGKLLWAYDTNSPLVCSPAVDSGGNVYVGAENGKLYAIDRTGRLLWTHTTDGLVYSSPVVLFDNHLHRFWKTPWEQPLQILVCSVDGTLYALGNDGSELWSFETDGVSAVTTGAIFASPAVDRDDALHIAGLYDPNLYALDLNNDDVKWNRSFSDPCDPYSRKPRPFASPVIAEDGTIYQTLLYDANLYAINPDDGNIIWSTNLADPCSGWFEPNYAQTYGPASCWSTPALAPDGTIYVNLNDPYLRAVDPNGTIKWVTKLGTIGGFTLTVGGDGLIYAACDDARLYVVDRNGQQVSQFEGFGALSFPTITIGHTILISDANNTVWAIGRHNCRGQDLALHQLEDLTGDGSINDIDLAVLTADWLDCTDSGPPCNYSGDRIYLSGDLNNDLYVDFADFAQLANRWMNKE